MNDPRLPHGISEAELEGRVRPLFPSKEPPYQVLKNGDPEGRWFKFDDALNHAKVLAQENADGTYDVIDIQNLDELDLDDDGLTQAEREALREEL